jgi:O-methyltransferase involved in polyketide biosynthesis
MTFGSKPSTEGELQSMEKLHPEELTGVSETLLIPLHYRVEESRKKSAAFRDATGERFHDLIDYDWSKFQDQPFHRRIMGVRTTTLDDQVGNFLAKNPAGLVVNLGAGLDTRFYRLDNGSVHWIEFDLPGVISFRRKLQEPVNERHQLLVGSVLDESWVANIRRDPETRVMLVAEGLLPYFSEQEHRKIFAYLADHFPGQEMLFQTSAPSLIQGFVQYSNLSKLSSKVELRWGLEDSTRVSDLDPRVRFVQEFPFLAGNYDSLPDAIKQKLSPAQALKIGKIVPVRFDAAEAC